MTYHLIGQKFGKLTVLALHGRSAKKSLIWLCRCECGADYFASSNSLVRGTTKYCLECSYHTSAQRGKVTHGEGRPGKQTRTFITWMAMRTRVNDPKKPIYYGMYVDPEWMDSLEAFKRDMGDRPDGMTLDRIDPHKGYYRENCRWATPLMQSRNRKMPVMQFTVDGVTKYISEWAAETGYHEASVRKSIRKFGRLPTRAH